MVFQKGHNLGKGRIVGSKNVKTLAQLARWQEEQDRIFEAMKGKDISEEHYKELVDAADKAQKNIQLLSGEPTERTDLLGVEISVRK